MSDSQSSYRQIIKATSIFGGVQVFSIVITIFRTKIIAVLLGPFGIGINSLLNSTIGLITGLTNFGLGTSAVKNIAAAYSTGNQIKIAIVVTVLRRLVWITGLLGAVLTIILSQWLSQLTFGTDEYTLAFIWISITLLLNQISTGQSVVLRGFRKINYLARSSLSGTVIGLFISIPIYYVWGIDGIVPAIIVTSIANLIRTWYFARKIKIEKVEVSKEMTLTEGKEMLIMGFMLSLSGLYVLVKDYGIRAYISNVGGLTEVGLYAAGFAIVNTYVGLVFTAMSTDYFPRLSAVSDNNSSARDLINQQAEIGVLILGPLITIFIVFIDWIVVLLYSSDFVPINKMIQWAALGMIFKVTSWSNAYIFLAKGKSKMFLANELFGGTITLFFHVGGYYFGGLTGMGIGFLLGYLYYMIQVSVVSRKYFEFKFENSFINLMISQLILGSLALSIVLFSPGFWSYFIGIPIIILSLFLAFNGLDERIGLKMLIRKFLKK